MSANLQIEGHKLQYHPDRVADFLAGRTVWPVYAEISPMSVCNHHCLFCNFNYLGHAARQLPPGRMMSLMDEFARAGVKAVVFAGAGEPSLHPDTFPAIERARRAGLDAAMSTNGALLTGEQIRSMAELLAWARFSVNGGTAETYGACNGTAPADLDNVLGNLGSLANYKKMLRSVVTIGAQCVLMPENHREIRLLARKLKDAGADYFSVKHFYPHPGNAYRPDMTFLTPAFLDELQNIAREMTDGAFTMIVRDGGTLREGRTYSECHGLPFLVYVREDGKLYTCFSHQEDGKTAIGNLLENDFRTLWESVGKTAALEHINRHYDKNLCQANCRHHQINLWLHRLKNPPAHVNFI